MTSACEAQNFSGGCGGNSITPELADTFSKLTGGTLGAVSPGQAVAVAGEQMAIRASSSVAKSLGSFADEAKLIGHFVKHGGEFGAKSREAYLALARHIMNNGIKVSYTYKDEIRTGFVQLMGQTRKGSAKFAFVGTNSKGYVTTMHVKSSKQLWQTLNQNKNQNIIIPAN